MIGSRGCHCGVEWFMEKHPSRLLALIAASGLGLIIWILLFGPETWWHQAIFFLLVWWVVFLLGRLLLRRYWSFWLALAATGYLWLRFMKFDTWPAVAAWPAFLAALAKLLDKP